MSPNKEVECHDKCSKLGLKKLVLSRFTANFTTDNTHFCYTVHELFPYLARAWNMRLSVLFLCLWILSPVSYAAKLYVNTTPNDAKIQLLSQKATFSQGVELSRGEYFLSVSKQGFQRYLRPVVVGDEDITLNITLEQTAFPLTVTVTPADAQVRILNILQKFQQNMWLPRGKYEVEVRKTGYATQQQTVEIKDQAVNLTITLQPAQQSIEQSLALATTQPMYPLYVYPLPKDASVELVDATTAFQQGMSLPTGIYHVRVSKAGYISRHEWIKLGKGGSKVKIELSQPNSCYFAEEKIEDSQEVASTLRNITLKPRGDLLEVSYYEQKLPASEAIHLEFIGVNRGQRIKLMGTFDNNGVSEEITAELLIYKNSLSINFKGIEAMLNETSCF